MKQFIFLIPVLFSWLTGTSQYFIGERQVPEKDLPGLISLLNNSRSDLQKADILLKLSTGYLYKPKGKETHLDSARFYAQKALLLSTHIKNPAFINEALLLIAMVLMNERNETAANGLSSKMNDSTKVKLQYCLSRHYYVGGNNLDSSVHYARAAIKVAIKTGFWRDITLTWLYEIIKTRFVPQNLTAQAEKEYLFMAEHPDVEGKYLSKIFFLTRASDLLLTKGDFQKSLGYAISAERSLHSNSTHNDLRMAYNCLAHLYRLQDKYDKSLFYYAKLMADPEKYDIVRAIYITAYHYCYCLLYLNRIDEVLPYMQKIRQRYTAQSDHDKSYYYLILAMTYEKMNMLGPAEENYLEAIRYETAAKRPVATLHAYLGTLYLKFKHHDKALMAYKTAEQIFTNQNDLVVSGTLALLSTTEATLGDYESAYKHLLKSKTITDSIYDVSKEKHTQELEFQYQTQKKEADLRLKEENIRSLYQQARLMEQEGKLQQAKLNEASLLAGQKEAALQLREKDIALLKNISKLQEAEAETKRNITIIVIVLLAVIITLLCWLFWSKLRSNRIMQQLLTDKSWLLKEMHHRVKNNLHTVMSLLESQSAYLENDALEAVKNSQSRIFSMSLIHQKLYQSEDVSTINMAFYIPELVAYLRECFNLQNNFHIHMDIDHAEFDVTEAVPLGLIVNEAVTNSLKYAFKNKQYGEIHISLKATGENDFELIMADNGIGLQAGFDIKNITSLGFKLIKGLSTQLEARLQISNENGLKITLSGITPYRREFNHQLTA